MDVPGAGRALHTVNFLHEDRAVREGFTRAHVRYAAASVRCEPVKGHCVVSVAGQAVEQGRGLHQVTLRAKGREPVAHLGQGQRGVRV